MILLFIRGFLQYPWILIQSVSRELWLPGYTVLIPLRGKVALARQRALGSWRHNSGSGRFTLYLRPHGLARKNYSVWKARPLPSVRPIAICHVKSGFSVGIMERFIKA